MYRAGYRDGMIKVGDKITVYVAPLRDGSDGGYVTAASTADGRRFGPQSRAEQTDFRKLKAEIEAHVDEINEKFARVEQVKKIAILPRDLSQEGGELTPTMKVKRNVVHEKFADVIDSLYEQGQPKQAG